MGDAETIFGEALRRESPQGRAAFLDQACRGDMALRGEIEALLAAHARAGEFMHSPAHDLDVASLDPRRQIPTHEVGSLVGPYKLLEPIGEGGMGVVFMAEQLHPVKRKVALKIIKPGMDTAQVIARFEAERQALAMMDHPHIARVFEAGATDAGRPYFVMELVKGIPITDYCDQNQLTPRDRLKLFVQVCRAVQHAHQKGIIHRDLKPTNVLVTLDDAGSPVPKVIDFGIAKATAGERLTERTLFTEFRQLVGTPLYMSPEQAATIAVDADTRSDVYSLGVLLYELLTGTTPFEKDRLAQAAQEEVRRIIREEDPPRPSTRISTLGATLTSVSSHRGTDPKKLGSLVRGELDWIVMRAMEKDRTRRYETASGMARDVERYLADEPVEACPPSRVYRLRKVIRRHKAALGTAAAIGAVLVLATVVSTWQAIRATRAKESALKAEHRAMLFNQAMRDRMLEQAHAEARGLTKDPHIIAKLHRASLDFYMQAAEGGDASAVANLGLMLSLGEEGLDVARVIKLLRENAQGGGLDSQRNLGAIYRDGKVVPHDAAEALKWFKKASEQGDADSADAVGVMYSEGDGVPRDDAEALKWFRKAADRGSCEAYSNLGVVYEHGKGTPVDYGEAIKWYLKAAEEGYIEAITNLGRMFAEGKGVPRNPQKAIECYREAAGHGNVDAEALLGVAYRDGLGVPQDYAEALKWFREAANQGEPLAQTHLAGMYLDGLGVAKDGAEAIKWYRKAAAQGIAAAEHNLGHIYWLGDGATKDSDEAFYWFHKAADHGHAESQRHLGVMYFRGDGVAQDSAEAVKWYRKAADGGDLPAQLDLAQITLKGFGVPPDRTQALKYFRIGIENLRKTAGPDDPESLNHLAWLLATCELAEVRDGNEAIQWAQKAVAARKDAGFVDTLAAAYAEAGQFDQAVSTEREAIALNTDPHLREELESHLKLFERHVAYCDVVIDPRSKDAPPSAWAPQAAETAQPNPTTGLADAAPRVAQNNGTRDGLDRLRDGLTYVLAPHDTTSSESDTLTRLAALRLYLGDEQGYEEIARQMRERFPDDPVFRKLSCVGPGGLDDAREALRKAATRPASPPPNGYGYFYLGTSCYRLGDFDRAADDLARSVKGFDQVPNSPTPTHLAIAAEAFQAMAEWHRGHGAEAHAALDRARQRAKRRELSFPERDIATVPWCISQVALRKAAAMIEGRMPIDASRTGATSAAARASQPQ